MVFLNIVTGSWNRRSHLLQFVSSVRRNMPLGIDYLITVVDGGSSDGSQAWCKEQPDINLIEHGELKGAIRAFCDGAKAVQSTYTLLANDDVTFLGGSILPAIVHLETHPQCGAVCFADDRPAPGYAVGFKVQTITMKHGGKEVNAPYAQVGLFRTWLGNTVGWWGDTEPLAQGMTYGGDAYLSARIWESGYSIDSVDLCKVNDHMPNDGLRERNYEVEQANPGWYYQRYPTPPVIGGTPIKARESALERLRVLYLPTYEPRHGRYKRGLRDSLGRVGLVFELDYLNQKFDLPAIVEVWQPHLMLMQAHSATSLPLKQLVAARQVKPDMVVVNWNGDVHNVGLIDDAMLAYLRHVDLQLVVNESVLPVYRQHGIPAAYWQIGFEPVTELPEVRTHDVVFLANGYSQERLAIGKMLQNLPGVNVGLYGRGWQWPNGDTTYNFAAGRAIYQHAKIAIGDNQYSDQRGFVSNRLFEALASGVFLLHQTVPGLEELTGIVEGEHYVGWQTLDELQDKITYWLKPRQDKRRREIADAGKAFVERYHSFDARVRELFGILERMEEKQLA